MTNYHGNNANSEMESDLQSDGAGYDDAAAGAGGVHGGDEFLQHPDDEDDVDAGDDMVGEDADGAGVDDDDDGEFLLENENSVKQGPGGGSEPSGSVKLPSATSLSSSTAKQQPQINNAADLQQRKVNNNLVPAGMQHMQQQHLSQAATDQHNHSAVGQQVATVGGVDASSVLAEHAGGVGGEEDDPNQYGEQELLDYDEEDDENADYGEGAGGDGESLADMRSRIREMEEEADKLREMQTVADKRLANKPADPTTLSADDKMEIDARSVYVGNVDYGATAEELEKHFHACGNVVRVTILCDKFTGYPKGFAYIEFGEKEAVDTALALDESMFRGRQIKVSSKRTNQPGISTSDRGRGRGGLMVGRGGRPMRRPFRGGGGGPTFASRARGGFGHGFNPYARARPRGRRPTRFFYRGAV